MKKTIIWSLLCLCISILFAVAEAPTAEKPYMPLSEIDGFEVIGDITVTFVSKDDVQQANEDAYAALLAEAKKTHGASVGVGDIIWASPELVQYQIAQQARRDRIAEQVRLDTQANLKKGGLKGLGKSIGKSAQNAATAGAVVDVAEGIESTISSFTYTATAKVVQFAGVAETVEPVEAIEATE